MRNQARCWRHCSSDRYVNVFELCRQEYAHRVYVATIDKADVAIRGGDNNVYVAIAKYQPRVRCDQTSIPAPPWRSCYHVWGDMEATQKRQVFGTGSDPSIQVRLPYHLKASEYFPVTKSASRVHRPGEA